MNRFTLFLFLSLTLFYLSACSSVKSSSTNNQKESILTDKRDTKTQSRIKQEQKTEQVTLFPPRDLNCEKPLPVKVVKKPSNLWDILPQGYNLYHPEKFNSVLYKKSERLIENEIKLFSRRKNETNIILDRAQLFLYHIYNEVKKRDMPLEVALLPIVESGFKTKAYSSKKAAGLWQFLPRTGRSYGLNQDWWFDDRQDPIKSTKASLTYLTRLYKRFDRDWTLALAAYNGGQGRIGKAIKRNKRNGLPTDFWHLKLPKETRRYVPKLIAISRMIKNPGAYGLKMSPIPIAPYFESVTIKDQLDMNKAAELAGIDFKTLSNLNGGIRRWATPPKGTHKLLIPTQKVDQFKQNLAKLPKGKRMAWDVYQIKSGDTLSHIAKRYRVGVTTLKKVNNIRGHRIRAGKTLLVPFQQGSKNYTYAKDVGTLPKELAKHHSAYSSSSKKTSGDIKYTTINYIISRGDNIWDLSRQFNTSSKKIISINNIDTKKPLKLGQKIKIPVPISSQIVDEEKNNSKLAYKVKRGDSLYLIAKKFKVSIQDIVRWNQVNLKRYLKPGQLLTLYISETS